MLGPARPTGGGPTTLPEVRDRDHLAELAAAADLDPPTPDDLDRIAELVEARFGLDQEAAG